MHPNHALPQAPAPSVSPHPTPQSVLAALKERLPKRRHVVLDGPKLTWFAEPPTVYVEATQHDHALKVEAFSKVGRLTDPDQALKLIHLWGGGEDATATLKINPAGGVVVATLGIEHPNELWHQGTHLFSAGMLIEMLALRVRRMGKLGSVIGLTDIPDGETQHGWTQQHTVDARKRVGLAGMQHWSQVTLTGASKLGPWFYGTKQDERLKEMLAKGWCKHVGRTGSTVTLLAPTDEPHLSRVELSWADYSLTYGPMLRILVWPRNVQPATASGFFRAQGPFGGAQQVGNWVASQGVPSAEVPDAPAPEGLAFAVHLPTAVAHPLALDTVWAWAERQAAAASRRTAN